MGIEGLVRLKQRGHFIRPTASTQTIKELEEMTSPVTAFVKDRCTLKPNGMVIIAALFDEWRRWCAINGHEQVRSELQRV